MFYTHIIDPMILDDINNEHELETFILKFKIVTSYLKNKSICIDCDQEYLTSN